jgi:hypothetical protein
VPTTLHRAALRRQRSARRERSVCVRSEGDVSRAESGAAALSTIPVHFELPLAVLLAGFAFESYNSPVGGVRDADTSGTTVAFMSKFVQEAFQGVLEVSRCHRVGVWVEEAARG